MEKTEERKRRGSITRDPELQAMHKIVETLEALPVDVRAKVLDYLFRRYMVTDVTKGA